MPKSHSDKRYNVRKGDQEMPDEEIRFTNTRIVTLSTGVTVEDDYGNIVPHPDFGGHSTIELMLPLDQTVAGMKLGGGLWNVALTPVGGEQMRLEAGSGKHVENEWTDGLLEQTRPCKDPEAIVYFEQEWDCSPPEWAFTVPGTDVSASVYPESNEVNWTTNGVPEEPIDPFTAEALGHALIAAAHKVAEYQPREEQS